MWRIPKLIAEASGFAQVKGVLTDPDFIAYLFDPEDEYDVYFLVGNPEVGTTERIGVVKKMLLAHSLVFRAELKDSKIAEKGVVKIPDIFPSTFKNLLRFVYGYDNTEVLNFDDADDLYYAAEKYMMPKLKNRLTTRLMSILDCNNICSLMNNPACYNSLELSSAITEILYWETEQVLASPQFLNISPSGFLKILEQETCNVPEIKLWKSAIEWAKNRGGPENGEVLRSELTVHLQHIRFCSMSSEELFDEVLPTEVLTYKELKLIAETQKSKKVQPNLTTICNVVDKRDNPFIKSDFFRQTLRYREMVYGHCKESTFILTTGKSAVELFSMDLYRGRGMASPHRCDLTISIEKDTKLTKYVKYTGQIGLDTSWTVPMLIGERNVQLSKLSSYVITFRFSCNSTHNGIFRVRGPDMVAGDHFSVYFQTHFHGCKIFHIDSIQYRILTERLQSAETSAPKEALNYIVPVDSWYFSIFKKLKR